MKALSLFMLCSLSLTIAFCASAEPPDEISGEPSVQAALQDFKRAYSAELVIGEVLEVNGLKIIPLATAGLGVAPQRMHASKSGVPGIGGLMLPVGVIVVSDKDVRIVQVSKGFVEQLVSALAPFALQALQTPWGQEGVRKNTGEQVSAKASPQNHSFFVSYLKGAVLFWIFWAVCAVLIQRFLPDKVAAIAAGFRYHAFQISLLGLVGLGIMFLLAIIFTISLIGIPFSFALFLLGGIFTFFGSIGLALFIGQQSATAFKYHYSEARLMLIGGGLFGLLGMIPLVGILAWTLVAIFGFGAILQVQRENLHKRPL